MTYPPGYFPLKRKCAECGDEFTAKKSDHRFCRGKGCSEVWHNRHYRRAREIYDLLYEMQSSHRKRHLISEVTRSVRAHVLEDRREGRSGPVFRER